jgi:hypothetical protein
MVQPGTGRHQAERKELKRNDRGKEKRLETVCPRAHKMKVMLEEKVGDEGNDDERSRRWRS